ncbi:MAG: hypothetical protein HW406_1827, partial [Candidatus Brocadiaceae bacterium]|nr:hypothetical protein [Candidatus Brocadiaceae bacterium]
WHGQTSLSVLVFPSIKLESPLLGGDLGVGKLVIREIFTEIPRHLSS